MLANITLRKLSLILCLFIVLFFFFQLGLASLTLAKKKDPTIIKNTPLLFWNPLFSNNIEEKKQIQVELDGARKQLLYMTFPEEQAKIAKKIELILQKQVNQTPFDDVVWKELLVRQEQSGSNALNRVWSMATVLLLNGWHRKTRLEISTPCLEDPSTVFKASPNLCEKLLLSLSKQELLKNSKLLRLNNHFIKRRIVELERKYSMTIDENKKMTL